MFHSDGGYDIQDFKAVNPMFGTMADLRELFAKAKELNLKIILDFVSGKIYESVKLQS